MKLINSIICLWLWLAAAMSPATMSELGNENNSVFDMNLTAVKTYKPEWDDLDSRPLPQWYDQAKIGIFLHWGVYSVPGFHSEWFWSNWLTGNSKISKFMKKNYPPGFTYQNFAPSFTAEFFKPADWANLFLKAGAKYIVLTSKHHDGYTLFPSRRSFSWNSVDVGPKRDLVRDLAVEVKKKGIEFGVYHSLYEWRNPLYLEDKRSNFKRTTYTDTKLWPEIKQVIQDYEPSLLWLDGHWEANDTYWKSTDLLAWIYNESPVKEKIVVNDRWGFGMPCHHGGFYNCDDRYNPGTLQKHKWENAFTMDRWSWGYRRNMQLSEILTMEQLLKQVVSTVSCGGNALINVGPTKEGTIAPIFEERLLDLGKWLNVNGEAIYNSSPWTHQKDSLNGKVWYTCTKKFPNARYPTAPPSEPDSVTAIYAIFLKWPTNNILAIRDITQNFEAGHYKVYLLGDSSTKSLEWNIVNGTTYIILPSMAASLRSNHAWTLKIQNR